MQRFLVTPERVFAHEESNVPPGSLPGAPLEAVASGAATAFTHPGSTTALPPLRVARRDATDAFERAYLQTLLEQSGGNMKRAATTADVSRQMVQKLMRKHGFA